MCANSGSEYDSDGDATSADEDAEAVALATTTTWSIISVRIWGHPVLKPAADVAMT